MASRLASGLKSALASAPSAPDAAAPAAAAAAAGATLGAIGSSISSWWANIDKTMAGEEPTAAAATQVHGQQCRACCYHTACSAPLLLQPVCAMPDGALTVGGASHRGVVAAALQETTVNYKNRGQTWFKLGQRR